MPIIKIVNIIHDKLCISEDDGQKIFNRIKTLLCNGHQVILSFKHVLLITPLFLNVRTIV